MESLQRCGFGPRPLVFAQAEPVAELPEARLVLQAVPGWESLADVDLRLFSSEHVLDEAVSVLVRQAGAAYVSRWARDHLALDEITRLNTCRDDWHEALRWLEKFADQKVSFTDCLSFSLMRREALGAVFGFDRHFELAGFELWPRL